MKSLAIAVFLLISSVTCAKEGSADFKMEFATPQTVNIGFPLKDSDKCKPDATEEWCPDYTKDQEKIKLTGQYPEENTIITYIGEEMTYELTLQKPDESGTNKVVFECKKGEVVEQKIELGDAIDVIPDQCADENGISCQKETSNTAVKFTGICKAAKVFNLKSTTEEVTVEFKLLSATEETETTSISDTSKFSASLLAVCLLLVVGF